MWKSIVPQLKTTLEELFRNAPAPTAGKLLSKNSFQVQLEIEEPLQAKTRSFMQIFTNDAKTPPIFTEAALCEVLSPSRKLKAIFRKAEESKDDDIFLEIWNGNNLALVKDLKKDHGRMSPSPITGIPRWSTDENLIVYTAEPVPVKKSSFWSEDAAGNEYEYEQNFGETMANVKTPKLFVFNISTQEVTLLETPNFNPFNPSFRPNSTEIAYTGMEAPGQLQGLLQGLVACGNRPSSLFYGDVTNWEPKKIDLAQGYEALIHPRYTPDGNSIIYIAWNDMKVHMNQSGLISHNLSTGENKVLLDANSAEPIRLYGYQMDLEYDFVSEQELVITTQKECSRVVWLHNIETNTGKELELPIDLPYITGILDIHEGQILLAASAYRMPPVALLGSRETDGYSWKTFTFADIERSPALMKLKEANLKEIRHGTVASQLLYTEKDNPLVVIPHGGPHSCHTSRFGAMAAMLINYGYNILYANFTGSTGFDRSVVDALPGNIGQIDLEDIQQAITIASETVDTGSMVSYGGSYGGYMTYQLCQLEEFMCGISLCGVSN